MSVNDPTPSPPEWVTLAQGERVWLRAAPSTNLVLAALAVGFVILLVLSVVVGFVLGIAAGRAVSFAGLVLVVALLLAAAAVTRTRDYLLTSERVCAAVGVTDKRVTSADLDDVQAVTVEQSSWQGLVNVGDLRFVTEDGSVEFALVADPARLHRQALQFVDVED